MTREMNCLASGGGIKDCVVVLRGNGSFKQNYWLGEFTNQYRYVRLLSTAEAYDYFGADANTWVTQTTATYVLRKNGTWGTATQISTTDLDIGSFNLGDNDVFHISLENSSSSGVCALFHN